MRPYGRTARNVAGRVLAAALSPRTLRNIRASRPQARAGAPPFFRASARTARCFAAARGRTRRRRRGGSVQVPLHVARATRDPPSPILDRRRAPPHPTRARAALPAVAVQRDVPAGPAQPTTASASARACSRPRRRSHHPQRPAHLRSVARATGSSGGPRLRRTNRRGVPTRCEQIALALRVASPFRRAKARIRCRARSCGARCPASRRLRAARWSARGRSYSSVRASRRRRAPPRRTRLSPPALSSAMFVGAGLPGVHELAKRGAGSALRRRFTRIPPSARLAIWRRFLRFVRDALVGKPAALHEVSPFRFTDPQRTNSMYTTSIDY